MSAEAESILVIAKANVVQANKKRLKYFNDLVQKEVEAEEHLENTVAYLVSKRRISETRAGIALNCSRAKVKGMIRRANTRNRKLMSGIDNAS